MNTLQFYGFPYSQPTRSVLLLLKAAGVEFENHTLNLMAGEHKNESFRAINPAGFVPAIKEGDFTLAEGAAILQYIAESRSLSNWYPTDLKERAKVNQWLHWHHGALRRSTTKFLIPAIHKTPISEEELQHYRNNLEFLNSHLANSTFVASDAHPTIADLMLIPELDQLTPAAFSIFDYTPYPNVVRYMDSVKAAVSSYDEVFAPLAAQTFLARRDLTIPPSTTE